MDTANEGTSDWWLSPFADEAKISCNEYYCTITCVVYRTLLTSDSNNDVQFSEKSKIDVVGGYQVWETRTAQKNNVLIGGFSKGKSELTEIEYGDAQRGLGLAVVSLAAIFSFTMV